MSRRLGVTFFQEKPAYGLCEYHLSMLVNGLAARDMRLRVICPQGVEMDRLQAEVAGAAEVVRYPAGSGVRALRAVFDRNTCDLVHFNDPCPRGMVAARLAGVRRRVVTFHTPTQPFAYNWRGKLLQRAGFGGTHIVVTSASQAAQVIGRYHFSAGRVRVINYAIDPSRFEIAEPIERIRAELGIGSHEVVIGNVAMLRPQKNQMLLLDAFDRLRTRVGHSVRLLIVGTGELQDVLTGEIRRRGLQDLVRLTGYRVDVARLLAAMDIFVISSDFEGQCYAVLEAMVMGLPVASTRVGGIPDVVIQGRTGLLVPPRDAEALAAALGVLAEHPAGRQAMGAAARERVAAHYSVRRMVAETMHLYGELLAPGGERTLR